MHDKNCQQTKNKREVALPSKQHLGKTTTGVNGEMVGVSTKPGNKASVYTLTTAPMFAF